MSNAERVWFVMVILLMPVVAVGFICNLTFRAFMAGVYCADDLLSWVVKG